LEVTDLEGNPAGAYRQNNDFDLDQDDVFTPPRPQGAESAAESTSVYEPQPLPDDTGSYGVYSDAAYAAAADQSYATAAQGQDQQAYAYDGYSGSGYDQQQYGYDNGQQQYAAYSDPYIGTQTYGGVPYDTTYADQQQYGQQGYGQDQYATGGYGGETPAGGVWVPQQRTDEYGGELPPEQPYPYQGNGNTNGNGNGNGYDEQYRF